jgi:hypothetical protein
VVHCRKSEKGRREKKKGKGNVKKGKEKKRVKGS